MSWIAVARKDFRDSLRSRALWGISALFILLSVIIAYVYATFPDEMAISQTTGKGLIFFLASNITLFVSITAIVIAYKSLAGERESGSIKILLALPHTRLDVLLGKIGGRASVLAIPVVIAMAIGGIVGSVLIGDYAVVALGVFLLVSLLFTLTYISLVVGISAVTKSTTRASALAIGFFLLLEFFWDVISIGVVWATNGFTLPSEFPDWMFVMNQIPPSNAYSTLLYAVIPGRTGSAAELDTFYATPWLGGVFLLLWLVVPASVGYWRFADADL